ncbi:MAG: hypothetical protein ABIH70_04200 [Chloroflexota bacterium]
MTGKVGLALLAGILMPVLIWVAFGVVMNQKLRQWSARRKPAPTIGEILATARLSISGDTALTEAMKSKVLAPRSIGGIQELIAKAGLTLREETTSDVATESSPTRQNSGKVLPPESITT